MKPWLASMDRAEMREIFDRPLSIEHPLSMQNNYYQTINNTDSTKWVDVNSKNFDINTSKEISSFREKKFLKTSRNNHSINTGNATIDPNDNTFDMKNKTTTFKGTQDRLSIE